MTKTEIETIAHHAACQAVCAAHREAAYLAADPNRKCPEACEVADTCPLMQGIIEVEYDDTLPLTQVQKGAIKRIQDIKAGQVDWDTLQIELQFDLHAIGCQSWRTSKEGR
jgi:hypothetical protein